MQRLDAMRSPVWAGILLTIAIIGLLVAFHQVVRGAVQQGELRRQATATYAEAVWRCNALRARQLPGAPECDAARGRDADQPLKVWAAGGLARMRPCAGVQVTLRSMMVLRPMSWRTCWSAAERSDSVIDSAAARSPERSESLRLCSPAHRTVHGTRLRCFTHWQL